MGSIHRSQAARSWASPVGRAPMVALWAVLALLILADAADIVRGLRHRVARALGARWQAFERADRRATRRAQVIRVTGALERRAGRQRRHGR